MMQRVRIQRGWVEIAGKRYKYGGGAPTITFCEAAERYLHLKQSDWSKKMRGAMASIFKIHILPVLGDREVASILPTEIKELFGAVAAAHSESLTKKCITHTRAVFEMLLEDGLIARSPARSRIVRVPRMRRACERVYEREEFRSILEIARARSPRDYLLPRIVLSCGLRPAEAFALRLDDVEPGRLRIDEAAVPGQQVGPTKTEASNAYVPMASGLEEHLRRYIAEAGITAPRAFLFATSVGTPISHENYRRRALKVFGVAAGIDIRTYVDKKGKTVMTSGVNFQAMRRTAATHMEDHGDVASVAAVLRHSDPATTLKHYRKRLDPRVRAVVQEWDKKLEG